MNVGFLEVTSEGKILRTGHCPPETAFVMTAAFGGTLVFVPMETANAIDPNFVFYDAGEAELAPRPAVDAVASEMVADGVDELIFDFPEGTTGTVNGVAFTVDDASGLVFTTDEPGEYLVQAEPPFPYQAFSHQVTANAP